jgi:hypothetical protein
MACCLCDSRPLHMQLWKQLWKQHNLTKTLHYLYHDETPLHCRICVALPQRAPVSVFNVVLEHAELTAHCSSELTHSPQLHPPPQPLTPLHPPPHRICAALRQRAPASVMLCWSMLS